MMYILKNNNNKHFLTLAKIFSYGLFTKSNMDHVEDKYMKLPTPC